MYMSGKFRLKVQVMKYKYPGNSSVLCLVIMAKCFPLMWGLIWPLKSKTFWRFRVFYAVRLDTCSLKGTFTIQVSEVESKRQVKEIDLATHSGKQVAWLISIRWGGGHLLGWGILCNFWEIDNKPIVWPIPQVLKVGKSNLVSRAGGWLGTWGGDRQAVEEWRRQLGTATNHADHCWTTPITNPTFASSGKALSIAKNFPKSRPTLFIL